MTKLPPEKSPTDASFTLPLRDGERKPVTLRCEARIGVGAWRIVFLQDLSTHGFQMGRIPGLKTGVTLRIKVPGLQLLSASVRWVGEDHAGCAFNSPLSPYVFEHVVRRADL